MLVTPAEEGEKEEDKINSGKEHLFPDENQTTDCCPWNDNKVRRTAQVNLITVSCILPKELGHRTHNGFFHNANIYQLQDDGKKEKEGGFSVICHQTIVYSK